MGTGAYDLLRPTLKRYDILLIRLKGVVSGRISGERVDEVTSLKITADMLDDLERLGTINRLINSRYEYSFPFRDVRHMVVELSSGNGREPLEQYNDLEKWMNSIPGKPTFVRTQ